MTQIEHKILENLTSILLWYKDAGIVSLSENEAINQIQALEKQKQKQATNLPPLGQPPLEKAQLSLSSAQKTASSQQKSQTPFLTKDKNIKTASPHFGSSPRGYKDQLLSQSAQMAFDLVKTCTSLAEIKEKIDSLSLLALQKTAIHSFLGEGNEQAQLMVICDAPSGDDDRAGQILSAQAGALFDKMLASIGLERSEVFIMPAVFWRPPGDRKPTATEIATCLPIAEAIIRYVNPQIIMTLGTLAGQIFTAQNTSLNKMGRQFYDYENITNKDAERKNPIAIRSLYHPLDLIATPALKADAWHDLLAIKHKMKET